VATRWAENSYTQHATLSLTLNSVSAQSGVSLQVRKLEFLMAEAVAGGYDSVITIGGVQSNHCRATATAARLLGLEPHLILRTSSHHVDKDPGLVGNLLVERMQGAHLHMVRPLLST
jgi:D-cysteine desulfhydrase